MAATGTFYDPYPQASGNMKKLLFFSQLLLLGVAARPLPQTRSQPRRYYVSVGGRDSNDGQSPATPFASLERLSQLAIRPGDQIYLHRGETFRGELRVHVTGEPGHPVIIGAYGKGPRPVISGSAELHDWTRAGGHIWEAACSSCGEEVTGLYRQGVSLPLGRFPNPGEADKGFLPIRAHQGKTLLIADSPVQRDWTGAELVNKPEEWILDRALVTRQRGDTFTLQGNSYEMRDHWGYFIQNHPATLDVDGEWYYDKSQKKLLLFALTNPNDQPMEVTCRENGISLETSSWVSVQDLTITQTLHCGLFIRNCSYLSVLRLLVCQQGQDGITITGRGDHIQLADSRIEGTNNNGVVISGCSDLTVRNNRIRNIALEPGRGKGGDGQYNALSYSDDRGRAVIEDNHLDSLGYLGITFSSGNISIRHNLITDYDLTKSDGGGIYTWNGAGARSDKDQKIIANTVLRGAGAYGGTWHAYPGAIGIYLDDCSQLVEVRDNTIAGCTGSGIFLHGTHDILVTGNTCFNNGRQYWISYSNCGRIFDNRTFRNIFFSVTPGQLLAQYETRDTSLAGYGLFDHNNYVRPRGGSASVIVSWRQGNRRITDSLSVREWATRFGGDAHSSEAGWNWPPGRVPRLEYNATAKPRRIRLDGLYKDPGGEVHRDVLVLPPYSSLILIPV
jgi:parallel beta-helix repeat protein